jgi:hypothetical protein
VNRAYVGRRVREVSTVGPSLRGAEPLIGVEGFQTAHPGCCW